MDDDEIREAARVAAESAAETVVAETAAENAQAAAEATVVAAEAAIAMAEVQAATVAVVAAETVRENVEAVQTIEERTKWLANELEVHRSADSNWKEATARELSEIREAIRLLTPPQVSAESQSTTLPTSETITETVTAREVETVIPPLQNAVADALPVAGTESPVRRKRRLL